MLPEYSGYAILARLQKSMRRFLVHNLAGRRRILASINAIDALPSHARGPKAIAAIYPLRSMITMVNVRGWIHQKSQSCAFPLDSFVGAIR